METTFTITYEIVNDQPTLTISPAVSEGNNYKPKSIEVTEDQWNELRYHFATGVDDVKHRSILAYVI